MDVGDGTEDPLRGLEDRPRTPGLSQTHPREAT